MHEALVGPMRHQPIGIMTNKDSEFGRLPTEYASWIAHLLDQRKSSRLRAFAVKLTWLKGMIEFKRSTMVDCPAALHPGADLIISLSVYMLPSAFTKPSSAHSNSQQPKNMFEEGQESQDEQKLRERKSSLLKLFDAVSLKPQVGPDLSKFKDKSDNEMHAEDVKKMTDTSKPKAAVRTEIVGDGEEVEVEEGEDLSENELNTIYKRSAPQMLSQDAS